MVHAPTPIEKRHGFEIFLDAGDQGTGYWWKKGHETGGYFNTLEDAHSDIDDEWHEEARFLEQTGAFDVPEDTPCLERPWWEDR